MFPSYLKLKKDVEIDVRKCIDFLLSTQYEDGELNFFEYFGGTKTQELKQFHSYTKEISLRLLNALEIQEKMKTS